jgi:hypothetical protein
MESGLRDLVRGAGPDIRKLGRRETEGLQAIMDAAQVPITWPSDAKAAAVLTVIQDAVNEIINPRWKSAALAAFRLPPEQYLVGEYDSLARRWRALARWDGASDDEIKDRAEAYRGFWMAAANQLANRVERRFSELNTGDGWQPYRTGFPPSPPHSLPISFDRTDVLYTFKGHLGLRSISYRWLVGHAPVDHYEPVGWYYNEPDAPVEIVPLANCVLDGPLRDLPQGGRTATLRFSHTLERDECYFFAYIVEFHAVQPCRPTIMYEVRGLEMRTLVIRAQFDPDALPIRCWYFDVESQGEGWATPHEDAPELLAIAPNGYVAHTFNNCQRGRKFGLRWEWTSLLCYQVGRRMDFVGGDG